MRLPFLKIPNKYKRRIVAFGGLNLTADFGEGEMRDASGISHRKFPVLTQSGGSVCVFDCNNPTAAIGAQETYIATDDGFFAGGENKGSLSPGEKQLAEIGDKVVIFPDKLYYDKTQKKLLSMEGICRIENVEVTFSGNSISVPENVYAEKSEISTASFEEEYKLFRYTDVTVKNGKIIFGELSLVKAKDLMEGDIFSPENSEQKYSRVISAEKDDKGKILITQEETAIKNITEDIFSLLREGDTVRISGCFDESRNKDVQILKAEPTKLTFEENTFSQGVENSTIYIKRIIPDFTSVCVYENRLWGCEGNTLYASKLGDPMNFNTFRGLSTDSFAVESNSGGDFTAAKVYGNYCLFFKENKCYKLYGNKPANFSLTESFGGGIFASEAKSIVNINGQMFYRGKDGIYSFFGGLPQLISHKLGDKLPENCVAGGNGFCYYISGDVDGERVEYVYDTQNGMWSKSGEKDVLGYFNEGKDLCRLKANGVEKILAEADEEVEWFVEFCPFDEKYHKTKNYSRLYVTAELSENSYIMAEISRDGGEWKSVAVKYSSKKEFISIPCIVKSCHELRLRLSGKGKCTVESIVREFSTN